MVRLNRFQIIFTRQMIILLRDVRRNLILMQNGFSDTGNRRSQKRSISKEQNLMGNCFGIFVEGYKTTLRKWMI